MKPKHIGILENRQQELTGRLDRTTPLSGERAILKGGNIAYEISEKTRAVGFGGLGLVEQLVERLGVADSIDRRVHVLKRHLPYQESDHVLNLLYNVVSGGASLQDLELRRNDLNYLDALGAERIPDPTTAGDFLRRFQEADVIELLEALNEGRVKVWKSQSKRFRQRAILDVDGTPAPTTGECKEGMDLSYQGEWGYSPLIVTLANSNEVVYVVNRSGNRASHAGAVEWIDRSIELVCRGGFRTVRLRGDSAFSLTVHFDRWTDSGVEFIFGMDSHQTFREQAEALPEKAWRKLERGPRYRVKTQKRARRKNVKAAVVKERAYKNLKLEAEHVAEWEYQPARASQTYRMIVLRKSVSMEQGQKRLFEETRYLFYVTNIPPEELSTAEVVFGSNARCNQENVIEQLKNGVAALRMPVSDLVSNWAYRAIAAQAWNLKAWLGMILPANLGAKELVRMEYRRFLASVIHLPCQIVRSGRRLIFRLLSAAGWTRLLLEGSRYLKRWIWQT